MDNAAEKLGGPAPLDAHYSFIRSINNDLVLLGNAIMTRNNDISSIHDFVTDSINTLLNEKLKSALHALNEEVIGCDNDEDRLRLIAKMQHLLVQDALAYLDEGYGDLFGELSVHLKKVEISGGDQLKSGISHFQIDVLKFIPGIADKEHLELRERAESCLAVRGKDLNNKINELYEDINLLIQPSFDDLDVV